MADPAPLSSVPHSFEAERSVLGAVLVDNQLLNRVLPIVTSEDFYRESHRRIFRAMEQLSGTSSVVDPVTLQNELERGGDLETVGGLSYIASLLEGIPGLVNAEHHARIVKEKSLLRRLIEESSRIASLAARDEEPAENVLDEAEKAIFRIGEDRVKTGFVSLQEVSQRAYAIIEKLTERKELITGVPTGFADLDELTSGLQPSELIVLAARPSMGKTAFALNVAENAALRHGQTVGIFSLEMASEQLFLRMLGSQSRVDLHRLRTGRISREEWTKMILAFQTLNEAKIHIDDSAGIGVMEMRAKARRLKAEHGLDLLVVDYLQLMRGRGRYESRQQEISDISRSLKELAKELRIPILALSQLSRAPETRSEDRHRPRLSDLRECVTGDTLVCLEDGRRVPIRDLVGSAPQVLALSEDRRVISAKSDKVWCVGRRKTFEVKLASGRSIHATGRHRLYGSRGWVRVEDLNDGDSVAIARRLPEPAQAIRWPEARSMSQQGISQRSMAAMRGTSYGGSAHFRFAPSRATAASYAEIVQDEALLACAEDDLFWDRVAAIRPRGEEDVYDLTVPGPGSWLADGIVSHNSGAIEQDADVVIFIYRPEVYFPNDEERKGLAEIIIGKQRNGPIDTVRLVFLKQHTRFENAAFETE